VLRRQAWLGLTGAFLLSLAPAAQDRSAEYRLKAAFVAKFPAFAEWPPQALEGRKTIDICVARPNPFGSTLDELVDGETVQGRPLVTREVSTPQTLANCHVLFVPAMPAATRKALLARAATLPALTVGDDPAFLDEGGIVQLTMSGGRVRFAVNTGAARRAGLQLSSQLLGLAVAVQGGPS
jgi:hypothetical protein